MLDLSGILIALVSAGIGFVAMLGGPKIGVANGPALGMVVAGVLAFFASRQQTAAGTRNNIAFIPLWAWGMAACILGAVLFSTNLDIGPSALTPEQARHLKYVEETLRKHDVSGNRELGAEIARTVKGVMSGHKVGFKDKPRYYVDIDGSGARDAKHVTVYVQAGELSSATDYRKNDAIALIIKTLQQDYPQQVCAVALRSPTQWVAHGWANDAKHPLRVEITNDPPRF